MNLNSFIQSDVKEYLFKVSLEVGKTKVTKFVNGTSIENAKLKIIEELQKEYKDCKFKIKSFKKLN